MNIDIGTGMIVLLCNIYASFFFPPESKSALSRSVSCIFFHLKKKKTATCLMLKQWRFCRFKAPSVHSSWNWTILKVWSKTHGRTSQNMWSTSTEALESFPRSLPCTHHSLWCALAGEGWVWSWTGSALKPWQRVTVRERCKPMNQDTRTIAVSKAVTVWWVNQTILTYSYGLFACRFCNFSLSFTCK